MGLIEAFEEHLQKKDRSEYTVSGYVRDLQTFFGWLQAQTGDLDGLLGQSRARRTLGS